MTSTNRKRMVTPWCQISQKKKKDIHMLQPHCCFHVHAAEQGKHSLECWQIDVPLPPTFSRQWTIYFCGGSQVTSCRVFFFFFMCWVFFVSNSTKHGLHFIFIDRYQTLLLYKVTKSKTDTQYSKKLSACKIFCHIQHKIEADYKI